MAPFPSPNWGQWRYAAAEAKAMLDNAVAAVKADKTKALDMFNKGEGGFLDRNLYPFCFNVSDGKILAVASPNAKQFLGTDIRDLKDATGKVYGPELYAAAQKPEGQVGEVRYQRGRCCLQCRLLQVDRAEAGDPVRRHHPLLTMTPLGFGSPGFSIH